MTTTPDPAAPRPGPGPEEAALEAAFAAARAASPRPGAALMARILADAAAEAARRDGARGALRRLRAFFRALGGAPAAAGLSLAAAAGLWIGAAPPALLDGVAAAVWAAPAELDFAPLLQDGALEGLDEPGGTDA